MKKAAFISNGKNHSAIDVGALNDVSSYSLIHPKLGNEIKGKIFTKEYLNTTGMEISFQTLQAGTDVGYFHIHRKNEEVFIILNGQGEFQIDEQRFEVCEGSMVRIAPEGARRIYNTSDKPMTFMVIQAKAGSLEEYSTGDGERV